MPAMYLKTHLFLYIGIIIFSINVFAQNQNIQFERITIAHGLSQSSIQASIQDNQGFLW